MDCGVEKIEDHEIGPLWAEYYPKIKESAIAKTLVLSLCLIIKERARFIIAPYGDVADKIHHMLMEFGIPKDQFYEVEKEIRERKDDDKSTNR